MGDLYQKCNLLINNIFSKFKIRIMCTRSVRITGNGNFDSNVSPTKFTSAIFKVQNIINFLNEFEDAQFIIVQKVPGVNENDTLRMWFIDQNEDPIPFKTPIYATFPCPNQCVTTLKKVSSLTPLVNLVIPDSLERVFCVRDLRELVEYIDNQQIENGGIAFNTISSTELGMYTVKINHSQFNVNFNRFWNPGQGHPAFKAA